MSVPVRNEERDAILHSLYGERSRLNQARRLGEVTAADEEYLLELNEYIDSWEAAETEAAEQHDIWERLDALAASVLSVDAKIRQQKR